MVRCSHGRGVVFFSDTTNEWMVDGFCQMWMVKVSATPMNKPLPKQGFSFKAGEAIRTPDIHVGNVISSTQAVVLGV